MKKVTVISSQYWEYLLGSFKVIIMRYPIPVIFSFLIAALGGFVMFEEYPIYGILNAIAYFLGTNIMLISVSDKIEFGWANNSVLLHILFGTSTNKIEFNWWYFIPKIFVVMIKFVLAPLVLIIALLQYQSMINKAIAESKLEEIL